MSQFEQLPDPEEVSANIAEKFFGVTDEASRRVVIRRSLTSILWVTALVPLAFYLRFRTIGPLGWGTTVFLDMYCLLTAVGLYFQPRREFHSPVRLTGNWLDLVGAFWLVACVFGPFLGWIFTTGSIPITVNSWRWLYGLRVFFAAGLPIITALPLTRYIRGKSTWVALPLLMIVTLIPVSTAMRVSQDLWEGPTTLAGTAYLKHMQQMLGS
jgi:hypothetical protein